MRLDVADLGASQAAPAIAAEIFNEARRTSQGNLQFIHLVEQQFRLAPGDALSSVTQLLAARPTCPLGGEYAFAAAPETHRGWTTTAEPEMSPADLAPPPKGYRAPLLEWFHGLHLDFSIDDTTLTTHIELELQAE